MSIFYNSNNSQVLSSQRYGFWTGKITEKKTFIEKRKILKNKMLYQSVGRSL